MGFGRPDGDDAKDGIGLRQFELDVVFLLRKVIEVEARDVQPIQFDDQFGFVIVVAAVIEEMLFPRDAEPRNLIDFRHGVIHEVIGFLLGFLPFRGHELPCPIQGGHQQS